MTGTRRGTYGRLLLFAVLLLGVVTMHTLGHPSEHGGPAGHTAGHAAVASMPESVTVPAVGAQMPAPGGTDPSSVCLAVLGAGTLLLLLAAASGAARPGQLRAPSSSRLLRALWPNPPPPRHLLAQLSVLRI
jgi:hypothetical protein